MTSEGSPTPWRISAISERAVAVARRDGRWPSGRPFFGSGQVRNMEETVPVTGRSGHPGRRQPSPPGGLDDGVGGIPHGGLRGRSGRSAHSSPMQPIPDPDDDRDGAKPHDRRGEIPFHGEIHTRPPSFHSETGGTSHRFRNRFFVVQPPTTPSTAWGASSSSAIRSMRRALYMAFRMM